MLLSEDTFPLRLAIDRKTMKKQSFDDHVPPNIGAGAGAGAAGVGLTLGSTSHDNRNNSRHVNKNPALVFSIRKAVGSRLDGEKL